MKGILSFATRTDDWNIARKTYQVKRRETTLQLLKKRETRLCWPREDGFRSPNCQRAAAKPRDEAVAILSLSILSILILFLCSGIVFSMSDLQGFERMFRLDGKVAIITGGKHCIFDTRYTLTGLHRIARAGPPRCYSFLESRSS